MKRSIILPCLVTAFVALSPAGVALADNPHLDSNGDRVSTGQPNKEAGTGDSPTYPSGFDTSGFENVAEPHYAGEDLNPNKANTDKAASQYDVAAFQFSNRGPG
jgi:hypothetical protein